jgi:hypothetical protein
MGNDKAMAERRQTRRRRVAYRMDVTDQQRSMVGCLLDLSAGGMRVLCGPGVDIVGSEKLRIEFPRWLDLGDGLPVKGRFVWTKACGDGYGTEAGFAFDAMSKREALLLEALIEKLAAAIQNDAA